MPVTAVARSFFSMCSPLSEHGAVAREKNASTCRREESRPEGGSRVRMNVRVGPPTSTATTTIQQSSRARSQCNQRLLAVLCLNGLQLALRLAVEHRNRHLRVGNGLRLHRQVILLALPHAR